MAAAVVTPLPPPAATVSDTPQVAPEPPAETAQAEAKPPAAVPAAVPVAVPAAHVANPVADTIRVGVGVLDKLMTLAGELVLSRNQLLQTLGSKDQTKLEGVSARVDQVTTDLHETVMQARMQVVGTVFNRFPRVVRDLSLSWASSAT